MSTTISIEQCRTLLRSPMLILSEYKPISQFINCSGPYTDLYRFIHRYANIRLLWEVICGIEVVKYRKGLMFRSSNTFRKRNKVKN